MQITTDIKQANKIKELIKKECANYDNGQCILLEIDCPQMNCMYSVLCKYFINSILPLDKELYKQLLPDAEETKELYNKVCQSCNKQFTTDKKNGQYCPKCKDKIKKEKTRLRVQKHRDKCNAF
ncbi:Cysteine-rich VLP [Caloramator quimbayensis]|uniref:Cysteine-rich VLP n=1 Tax=Caloramator quimbayensis TaxID=1147123 RepID=A0A1T4XY07_9CLOT|nr:cysteine-rich VLP protein [Caloramator quimbayensis]SKA94436.1 Cysteine-rich VLP [Caloramator quimbayensis]